MSAASIAVVVLLALAVAIALVSAVGVAVLPDPFQRLHFLAPPSLWSALLITAAVFIDVKQKSVGVQAAIVLVVLAAINGVSTHATARAAWVRQHGSWPPKHDLLGEDGRERFREDRH